MKKIISIIVLIVILIGSYFYYEISTKKDNIEPKNIEVDNESPVIEGEDQAFYLDDEIELEKLYVCVDNIDKNIKCNIEGVIENKPGTYNIKVSAIDNSLNKSEKEFTITIRELRTDLKKYSIEIIRNENVVIVYKLDKNEEYKKVEKVFTVSVGKSTNQTPLGRYKTSKGYRWGTLVGGHYAQYSTRIVGGILFHSVPYLKQDASTLDWEEYNKLGEGASLGCIRMTVADVKWIFDNIEQGTEVYIHDGALPDNISKPVHQKLQNSDEYKGWDPTDPDENNPWNVN